MSVLRGGGDSVIWCEASIYHRTIMDVHRIVDKSVRMAPEAAAATHTSIKADWEVMWDLGIMAPVHRLRSLRIRMFTQVLGRRRIRILTVLVAGVKAEKSWLRVVLTDLAWAAGNVPQLEDMTMVPDWVWTPKFPTKTKTQKIKA